MQNLKRLRHEFMGKMRDVQMHKPGSEQAFDQWVRGLKPKERICIEADIAKQTERKLDALTADLNQETLRGEILRDCLAAGLTPREAVDRTGAIMFYLALTVSNMTPRITSLTTWNNTNEGHRSTFTRQAIQMTWDYAEVNPFGRQGFMAVVEQMAQALERLPAGGKGVKPGIAQHKAAQDAD